MATDPAEGELRLRAKLMALAESDDKSRRTRAGRVLGAGTSKARPPRDVCALVTGLDALNTQQRNAVTLGLGAEIAYIWGPPGTGKTDVVAALVEGCYRQGKTVLLVSPTHVAVDQALERVCRRLAGEPGFAKGLVRRIGEATSTSLKEAYGAVIDAKAVIATLGTETSRRLESARRWQQQLSELVNLRAEYDTLLAEVSGLRESTAHQRDIDDQAARAISSLRDTLAGLDRRIREAEQSAAAGGLLAGRRARQAQSWTAERDSLEDQLKVRTRTAADRARLSQDVRRREAEIQARIDELGPQLTGQPDSAGLSLLASRQVQLIGELHEALRAVASQVESTWRVGAATIAKAVRTGFPTGKTDVVIVDEAGMVDLPSAYYLASLAGERVVFAGDFRQLPAVLTSVGARGCTDEEKRTVAQWLARDPFEAAGLVSERGSVRRDARLVALSTQYRMRADICALVNAVAYPDAPLQTGRNEESVVPAADLLGRPLVLVDTSARRIPGHLVKSNPAHVAIIHELVRGLQYDRVLAPHGTTDPPEGLRPVDILGVITPYRDQVRALDASLAGRFGTSYEGLVETVHRFQGSQRPVVVIDTVAGAGDRVGTFYEGTGLNSTTTRLLNVAMSRAQDHLVVVADVDFLCTKLAPGSETRVMLDHLALHAQHVPVDELVPIRAADELAGLPRTELARPAFFPADEVPRAVSWDLQRAQRGIDVFCAFLDPMPVNRWAELLALRTAAGVRVTVHTREPTDARRKALLQSLESAGCEVHFRARMHEKVLIIDDILWHGSLNLFASSGCSDLMMRITSAEACHNVRRLVANAEAGRVRTPGISGPGRDSATTPSGRTSTAPAIAGRSTRKLLLSVPFDEKDEAKALGARWDREAKTWWVDPETAPLSEFARWLPADEPNTT